MSMKSVRHFVLGPRCRRRRATLCPMPVPPAKFHVTVSPVWIVTAGFARRRAGWPDCSVKHSPPFSEM